ncbi:MAG: PKD domain-containing protein [Gammaproteobacteria bacterium]
MTERIEVGDLDTYRISATQGEEFSLTLVDQELGAFIPEITVFGPDGNFIRRGFGATVASIVNLAAPTSGDYTILVRDISSGNANAGDYELQYVKAPQANEHGELPNASSVTERIEVGDLDTYRISATQGEVFSLTLIDQELGAFIPEITVFGPDGSFIRRGFGATVASIVNLPAPTSGDYTILVRDISSGNANAGDYELHYAKAPQANEHGELPNASSVTERIEVGDLDTYRISAAQGEVFSLTLVDQELGAFIPEITVFGPDGSFIRRGFGTTVASIVNLPAPTSGDYTVLVRDISNGNANTSDYELHYAKAPQANEHGFVQGSGSRNETITSGDLDTYQFTGVSGALVNLAVTDINETALIPEVTLFRPDGAFLRRAFNDTSAVLSQVRLPMDGIYTVLIRDISSGNANQGDYLFEFDVPLGSISQPMPVSMISGPTQIALGETIIVNGSDSTSPSETPLTYEWSLEQAPENSALSSASIVDAQTPIAQLQPDVVGEYTLSLTVNDGNESSSASFVIAVQNNPPIANAGEDLDVELGQLVELDGSASNDPDGHPLTYQWQFLSVPTNSELTAIDENDNVRVQFTPDLAGEYRVGLTVNDGFDDSPMAIITVRAVIGNVPPNAVINTADTVILGESLNLSASASTDPDNDTLSYQWQLESVPASSNLQSINIQGAQTPLASFTPDAMGLYRVSLTVSDGETSSVSTAEVIVTMAEVENIAPIAIAGDDIATFIGNNVTLNGAASNDPDASPTSLMFEWRFVSTPDDSALTNASILTANQASASFVPDVVGDFVLSLTVSDGEIEQSDNVLVMVTDIEPPIESPEILMCDLTNDGLVDTTDISAILALLGTNDLSGTNQRADWNEDGIVNVLDARGCVLQCTNAQCAAE